MNELKKEVTILYFAIFRDQANTSQEKIITSANTVANLFDEVRTKHDFHLSQSQIRVAKNNEFIDWNTSIEHQDIVAFIPPVAGG